MQTASADAKKRGNNQFALLFLSFQEDPVHPTPPAPDTSELLARLLPLQSGIQASRRTDGEVKQANETPAEYDRLGIATPELKDLIKMRGKPAGGTFDSLPRWLQKYE